MSRPTAYKDLNDVLQQLVEGTSAALGSNLCGIYLQGSFALGEADEHSDVDFIVATTGELTQDQQDTLQSLHARLFELDVPWAQHLEGSYVPKELLRRVDPSRTPCFYLDNGARSLIWADHCNTAHVRWLLRESGIVLAGPEPAQLVDPVSRDALCEEALRALDEYAAWAEESRAQHDVPQWQQPYLVLTFCRLLWTLQHAAVTSKRTAGAWAMRELDRQWADLIEVAMDDRDDRWARALLPSDPELVERTAGFVQYALRYGTLLR